MQQNDKLEQGNFYHIYSHGVGGRDLFRYEENYHHFLKLYDRYIEPVADTYAWALMPNHFHFVVRIKSNVVYKYSNADSPLNGGAVRFKDVKWQTVELTENPTASAGSVGVEEGKIKIPKPHLHFSHMLNAYSTYFNTRKESRGALFERTFKRKLIDNLPYLKQVITYIHNNPVHHGFCEHPIEYPWSSYLTCTSDKITKLKRDEVLKWFGNKNDFEEWHKQDIDKMDWETGV